MSTLRYYKPLDGLRATAALMVMVFHFFKAVTPTNAIEVFLKKSAVFGQTGVSLFFVLSGFLITRILIQTKNNKQYFIHFYTNRVLRILPLYMAYLLFYYLVQPLIFNKPFVHFNEQVYYWSFLQNIAYTFHWPLSGPIHLWSLAVEEQFYLCWPLVIFFTHPKKVWIVVVGIIVIALLTRTYFIYHHIDVYTFTLTRLDELAFGALLAFVAFYQKYFKQRYFLILLSIIALPSIFFWILNNASGNNFIQIVKYLLLAATYFAVVGAVITTEKKTMLSKILSTSFLHYTGKISYGLYVLHPFCFLLVYRFFYSHYLIVNMLSSFGLTYILAAISYTYFESYFLKYKTTIK